MGSCIQLLSTFIAGIVISLYRGWKLSLIIMSIAPILLVIAVVFIKVCLKLLVKIMIVIALFNRLRHFYHQMKSSHMLEQVQ